MMNSGDEIGSPPREIKSQDVKEQDPLLPIADSTFSIRSRRKGSQQGVGAGEGNAGFHTLLSNRLRTFLTENVSNIVAFLPLNMC